MKKIKIFYPPLKPLVHIAYPTLLPSFANIRKTFLINQDKISAQSFQGSYKNVKTKYFKPG